jgi:hypothetical protein
MLKKVKYSKIAVVIFLTILIWVWTDLTLDETLPVSGAKISIDESRPSLWVSFGGKSSISIDTIVLKGPASKISDVKRKIKDRSPSFEFFLDPEQEGMVEPNEPPLDVQNFLRKSDQIRDFGLTVESCKPDKLTVNVVELVERSLTVQCFDEGGISLKTKTESIEPPEAKIFVPRDWGRDKLTARVELTRNEIEQSRSAPIEKRPYVELAPEQIRRATRAVEIKMSPEEDPLKSDTVTTATLGYCLSENLQGKYKVHVDNLNEVISSIAIRATPEAKQAYEGMRYQVILEIDDEDAKSKEPRRQVVYNFPEEFVSKDEIMLDQPPVTARFKLTPLSSAENP